MARLHFVVLKAYLSSEVYEQFYLEKAWSSASLDVCNEPHECHEAAPFPPFFPYEFWVELCAQGAYIRVTQRASATARFMGERQL